MGKVDNPKPKEKTKILSSIMATSITSTSGNLSKRNKMKNTNVHVEFAPTIIKPLSQGHMQVTTSLIKPNLMTNQHSQFNSNILQSPTEKRDELAARASIHSM